MSFLARALSLAVLLAAAGCGGSAAAPPTPRTGLFDYDRAASIGLRDRGVVNHGYPVRIHDVSFRGFGGDTVAAFLMVPPGKGPFAGVVFVPGSGGSRADFLVPATHLAARGAVTLSIATAFVSGRQNLPNGVAGLRAFRTGFIQNVEDVRRGLDLLAARPDVDPRRLGVLGYSLGAALAGATTGVDRRVAAAALVAPPEHPHFQPPMPQALERRVLADVDPTRYLPSTHAAVLLALARRDQVIPRAEYETYIAAAPRPTVRWYDTDHHMSRAAIHDTLDWLADQLDLGPLPAYARG